MSSLISLKLLSSTLRTSTGRTVANALLDCASLSRAATITVSSRTLLSDERLSIDRFMSNRSKVSTQFGHLKDGFIKRMHDCSDPSNSKLVFSEDLKHCLYLLSNSPEELELLKKVIRKYNQQNKELRFGNFNFGPIIARLLHSFKQSDLALQLLMDEETESIFFQTMSYTVTMDLMFRLERYQDVLKLYENACSKGFLHSKFPKDFIVLVVASCYKMDTPESYNYALNLLKSGRDSGVLFVRRAVHIMCAMALKHDTASVALELLSLVSRSQNYFTTRNLRLLCLAHLGHVDDAIFLLRSILNQDEPLRKEQILEHSVQLVLDAAKNSGNPAQLSELESLIQSIRESGMISNSTLEDSLFAEITPRANPPVQRRVEGDFSIPRVRANGRYDNSREQFSMGQRRRPLARPM